MATRLIIDGNAVYEIDEECMERQKEKKRDRQPCEGSYMVRCQKAGERKKRQG